MSSEAAPAWSRLRRQPSMGCNLLFPGDYLLPTSFVPTLSGLRWIFPRRPASSRQVAQNEPYAGWGCRNRDARSFLLDFSPSERRSGLQPATGHRIQLRAAPGQPADPSSRPGTRARPTKISGTARQPVDAHARSHHSLRARPINFTPPGVGTAPSPRRVGAGTRPRSEGRSRPSSCVLSSPRDRWAGGRFLLPPTLERKKDIYRRKRLRPTAFQRPSHAVIHSREH